VNLISSSKKVLFLFSFVPDRCGYVMKNWIMFLAVCLSSCGSIHSGVGIALKKVD